METRGAPYAIFTVSYAGTQSYQPGWSIEVRPVARALKHRVKATLTIDCFPRIRQWLQKHVDVESRHGYHALPVVLDERDETLLKIEERHPPGRSTLKLRGGNPFSKSAFPAGAAESL